MTRGSLLDRWVEKASDGLTALGVVSVVAMMLATTGDVVARYVFNRPSMWADEIASYLLLAIVFLGLADNLRRGGHIRIDVVTNLLSDPVRRVLEVVAFAVTTVFSIILLLGTWTRFFNFWSRNVVSDSPIMTPLWIAMVPVLLGAATLCLAAIAGFAVTLHGLLVPAADASSDAGEA